MASQRMYRIGPFKLLGLLNRYGTELMSAGKFARETKTPEAWYAVVQVWDQIISDRPDLADYAQERRALIVAKVQQAKSIRKATEDM